MTAGMGMVAIFTGIAVLLVAVSLHPFITYPVSLWLIARRRSRSDPAIPRSNAPATTTSTGDRPRVAICMSAFNEEKVIVAKVETLLAMAARYGPATIHVYADCPGDATATLLAPYADRIDLVVGRERRGKTFGLNMLVDRSRSDLLLFTDANVVHDADALTMLARPFGDPTVGCTTAQLNYTNRAESATSAMGAFYWSVEETIKKIESETVGIIGVDGAMFVVRRSLYRPAPPSMIDDFYVSLNLLIQGARIISVDDVTVEERSAVDAREEFRRKTRIACQSINVHRALWNDLRRMSWLPFYAYLSHRVLKWLMPFLLAGAAACLVVAVGVAFGWTIAFGLAVGIPAVMLIGDWIGFRPASILTTAAFSLAGVAIGVLQSLFTSRTYTVWTPANSVRGPSGETITR